ncbi:MAG: UDP-3-O-(3-hydroxymyristoyl)glucosamine N-acyltransferase [Planctomycetota bacterium]|jgi:UDP-3-O-[3-hydroxymyristoyl] glucosamine N-acyltransferase
MAKIKNHADNLEDAMPEFSAEQLAEMVGGRLVGPGDVTVNNVRSLASAGAGDLAFLRNERSKADAEGCGAAIVMTPVELADFAGSQVVCEDAEVAMATVLAVFAAERFPAPEGTSELASVSPTATIGGGVAIGDYAVVGADTVIGDGAVIHAQCYVGSSCRIGARTVLHAGVAVHDRVTIGDDCTVHYNAVIGSAGFGFVQRDGRSVKLPQVGTVRIGNHVEIGALSTVDRALLEETVIEDGVKMDNHCHVAHNCHIGPDCIMAGGAKLGGSVRLGKGVICGEDSGVNAHVTIGEGAILGAKAGVPKNVPAGEVVLGTPARPIAEQRRIFAFEARLPQMAKRLRQLEKDIEALRKQLERGA